jgi:integration host factor subunit alpha
MTKADLVKRLQVKFGYSHKESADMLESLLDIIKSTLESGEDIKIAGFGKFEMRQKKDRMGRNPQTGESITIEARTILKFKPSAVLRQALNK